MGLDIEFKSGKERISNRSGYAFLPHLNGDYTGEKYYLLPKEDIRNIISQMELSIGKYIYYREESFGYNPEQLLEFFKRTLDKNVYYKCSL